MVATTVNKNIKPTRINIPLADILFGHIRSKKDRPNVAIISYLSAIGRLNGRQRHFKIQRMLNSEDVLDDVIGKTLEAVHRSVVKDRKCLAPPLRGPEGTRLLF